MLYSLGGIESTGLTEDELSEIKGNIRELLEEKKLLEKGHRILKSKKVAANYLSQNSDRIALEDKIKKIERVNELIGEQNIIRNMRISKKSQYIQLKKELLSLNRTMSVGEIRCLDCGSKNIGLLANLQDSYTFDISSKDMRKAILCKGPC